MVFVLNTSIQGLASGSQAEQRAGKNARDRTVWKCNSKSLVPAWQRGEVKEGFLESVTWELVFE